MPTTENILPFSDGGDNGRNKASDAAESSSADFRATQNGGKTALYTDSYYSKGSVASSTSVTTSSAATAEQLTNQTTSRGTLQQSSFNHINTSDAYFSAPFDPRASEPVNPLITQPTTTTTHIYDNVLGSEEGNYTSNDIGRVTTEGGGGGGNYSIFIHSSSTAAGGDGGGFGPLNTTLEDTGLVTSTGWGIFSMNGTQDYISTATAVMNATPMDIPSNFSEADALTNALGDRYKTDLETWILTFVYCAIFITGVVGNICTCIVIYKNNYMHTATNYYLFSLAISDVLTLILGLPPELYTVWEAYPWRFGAPYCLFKTFLTEMTSSASILTITAFTVERYVAICHPYRAQRMSSLSRATKIIVLIWVIACISAVPYPIHTRTFYRLMNPYTQEPLLGSLICNIPTRWLPKMRSVFQFTTFLLFIFPMTVITVLYLLIGMTLKKAGLARNTSAEGAHHGSQSRKIIQMLAPCCRRGRTCRRGNHRHEVVHAYLVAVVVAFFICWAPFHAQRLMTSYIIDEKQWTPALMEVQNILWYISGVLYFVSSTTNPILYNLMSRKYREAFKDTLCRACCKQGRHNPAQNGFTTNNRTRGYVTSDRSTIYSYYSNSSKKYTSMIPKDSHELNHYNRQLSNSSSDSNGGGGCGINQNITVSLAEEYKGIIPQKLDPISECSNSDTRDSFGSALSNKHSSSSYNQFNHRGYREPVGGCEEDVGENRIDSESPEMELLCRLDNDQSYGAASSVLENEPKLSGTSQLNQCRTNSSSKSSLANVSLVSGGSLSSLPAVLAGHLKEEMDLEGNSNHQLSQYQ